MTRQSKEFVMLRTPPRPSRNRKYIATTARVIGVASLSVLALSACGGKSSPVADLLSTGNAAVSVNPFLWAAALDTVSFMPNVRADGNAGTINTDWYSNPQNPDERMRLAVTISGQELRPEAVQVMAYRQVAQNGAWVDAPVAASTVQRLEGTVLTKARDMQRAAS
jgi:Domain of unknown function (DUF3576)